MEKANEENGIRVNTAGVFKTTESSHFSANPTLEYTINNELHSYWITKSPQNLAE